jgi:ankyrin repeat protein
MRTRRLLLQAGAALQLPALQVAALMCSAVYEGDARLLRRLLRAGAPAGAADYDGRTALHIAAAEGNLAMVQLLVADGGADVRATDRWQQTPLDEALRAGSATVVECLASLTGGELCGALCFVCMPNRLTSVISNPTPF